MCWADILRHTTRHDSQDPPAWLTVVCLDSVFSLEFPSVECFSTFYFSWFIPTDWSVRAEGENIMFYSNHYDSFKQWTPRLHCRCIPCLHPSSSTDWSDSCFYSKAFCSSASTDEATDPLGSKSVHLHMASFPFKPLTTLLNCFLSIHRTDQMSFTVVSRFNNQPPPPLHLPNSSSYYPPPVNPAPSPPTRELPLLLLRLCDNNNNCVAVQRAFCWASARPAGTGNPSKPVPSSPTNSPLSRLALEHHRH